MEINITQEEWKRIIYLLRKGTGKKPIRKDLALLFKMEEFAKQDKRDAEIDSKLLDIDDE